MADDFFGFIDANVPKALTPPAGYEGVHQDGMSWARQGDRLANTSWITVAQFNHLIAQFRGLLTIDGVDLSDVASTSPLLLREALLRAVLAVLTDTDVGGFGVMFAADYDGDADGRVDLAHGGTGVSASNHADLRDQLGITSAIATAIAALVGASPAQLDTINELAAALGNDANFAATVTAALAGKVPLTGGTMTGGLGVPFADLPNQAAPANPASGKTRLYVRADGAVCYRTSAGLEVVIGGVEFASQAEAEAGTETTKAMNALRTRQAIDARVPPKAAARAWVNFNGTGTVAIRDSFNVSSITDHGTGDYTVNFASALPNANYVALVTPSNDDLLAGGARRFGCVISQSASAVRVNIASTSTSPQDVPIVNIVIFTGA